MFRVVGPIAFVFTIVFCPGLYGQPASKISSWLDRDTAALIDIKTPLQSHERICELGLSRNDRFCRAVDMLSDHRFPIFSLATIEKFREQLQAAPFLLAKVEHLSIILHDFDAPIPRWSVLLKGSPQTLDSISKFVSEIKYAASTNLPWPLNPSATIAGQTKNNSHDSAATAQASAFTPKNRVYTRRFGDWIAISQNMAELSKLENRAANDAHNGVAASNFKSLEKNRSYQSIQRKHSSRGTHTGAMSIYVNPSKLKRLFSWFSTGFFGQAKMNEVSAIGLSITFPPTTRSSNIDPHPLLFAEVDVIHTVPAVGISKCFEYYEPIELPPLAVEPIELHAFSRDEPAVARVMAQAHDERFGEGATSAIRKVWSTRTLLDFENDALPRRQSLFNIRFVDANHTIDQPGLLRIEKVRDVDAAERYAVGVIEYANGTHKRGLKKHAELGTVWWRLPQEKHKANSGRSRQYRTRHTSIAAVDVLHDAYVLTSKWWLQGDMPAVRNQLELLEAEANQPCNIRDLIKDLSARTRAGSPFMILYYTKNAWQETINRVEQAHAIENSTEKILSIDHSKLEPGQRIDFLSAAQGERIPGISLVDKRDINQHNKFRIMKFMTPMALGERNENGYRFKITHQRDLRKAIEVMIVKSLAEILPRQLVLFTHADSGFRISVGIYDNALDNLEQTKHRN